MRKINLVVAVSYGFVCYVEVGFGGVVASGVDGWVRHGKFRLGGSV